MQSQGIPHVRPGEKAAATKTVLHRFRNPRRSLPAFWSNAARPQRVREGSQDRLRARRGRPAAANGAPKNPYHLALAFEWGEGRLPGVFAALEPVFRLLAKRARRKGIDRELEERYCL